jgi:hypothetical protein
MLAIASPCARVVDDLRRPPYLSEDIDASRQLIMIPARVVSRVRIPASQVFELMKVLEKQLSAWELETGQRPPDDTGLSNLAECRTMEFEARREMRWVISWPRALPHERPK